MNVIWSYQNTLDFKNLLIFQQKIKSVLTSEEMYIYSSRVEFPIYTQTKQQNKIYIHLLLPSNLFLAQMLTL